MHGFYVSGSIHSGNPLKLEYLYIQYKVELLLKKCRHVLKEVFRCFEVK